MKKIKYIIAGFALLFSAGVFAQDNGLTLKINYSVAFPTGSDFKDLISNTSYRGFGAELMYHTSNKFSIGLETGSQYFSQKYPRGLFLVEYFHDTAAHRIGKGCLARTHVTLGSRLGVSPGVKSG